MAKVDLGTRLLRHLIMCAIAGLYLAYKISLHGEVWQFLMKISMGFDVDIYDLQ